MLRESKKVSSNNWNNPRERFQRCAKSPSFKMTKIDDHIGERIITTETKEKWYNDCKTRLADKPSLLQTCEFGQHFLGDVTYISFDQFYDNLLKSFSLFLSQQGNRPYSFLLDPKKYGSEHWLLQILWQDLFSSEEYKQQIPDVMFEPNLKTDPVDIVILDDVVYSGFHTMGVIDLFFDDARQKGQEIPPNRYHFHIVIPYMSDKGASMLKKTLPEITSSNVTLYPIKILPSFLETEQKLGTNLTNIGYVEEEPSRYHKPSPGEKKRYHLSEDVAKELDLDPHGVFLPVYLDFKIAKNTSTATSILENLVRPLPSRSKLVAAEKCFLQTE